MAFLIVSNEPVCYGNRLSAPLATREEAERHATLLRCAYLIQEVTPPPARERWNVWAWIKGREHFCGEYASREAADAAVNGALRAYRCEVRHLRA